MFPREKQEKTQVSGGRGEHAYGTWLSLAVSQKMSHTLVVRVGVRPRKYNL